MAAPSAPGDVFTSCKHVVDIIYCRSWQTLLEAPMLSLKSFLSKSRYREYSMREASAVTRVPLPVVNKFISRDLASLGVAVWGDGKRSLSYSGLVAIRMAYEYPRSLAASSRVEVIQKALKSPRKKHLTLDDGKVVVRVDTARGVVTDGLKLLHNAESAVDVDESVLGGEPCLKGTRIPVYAVAEMVNSSGLSAVKLAYSGLSAPQIEAARMYAHAHPRRGRPKRIDAILSKLKPVRSKSVAMAID